MMQPFDVISDEFLSENGNFVIEHQSPGWKWVEFWQEVAGGEDSALVEFDVELIPSVIETLQEIYDRRA